MIFAEVTILNPNSWLKLYNHNAYISIGSAVEMIRSWEVARSKYYLLYFTKKVAESVANILSQYGFIGTFLMARESKESYADIMEILHPEILY